MFAIALPLVKVLLRNTSDSLLVHYISNLTSPPTLVSIGHIFVGTASERADQSLRSEVRSRALSYI